MSGLSGAMADNPRIEELRRRVREEPASIAFAQLAEELRRAAQYLEAVEVCRSGLEMYPGYLSVHVTLGRCLVELDRLDEAEQELERVRESAPDNLAAIRALSKIQERRGMVAGPRSGSGGVPSVGEIRLKPVVMAAARKSDLPPASDADRAGPSPATDPITAASIMMDPIATGPVTMAPISTGPIATDPITTYPITKYIDKLHHVEIPATRRARTVSEDEYMHIIRTLTALEAWLAAIHVALPVRSA
jgi:hypothetical protein